MEVLLRYSFYGKLFAKHPNERNKVVKGGVIMWCKQCNLETNETICPICGSETVDDVPVEIYWCQDCQIPLIHFSTAAEKGGCPLCGNKTRYLSSDLRSVFPEERMLLAILLKQDIGEYMSRSIWAVNSRYYVDGKSISISAKTFAAADTDSIAKKIAANQDQIDYSFFNKNIARFIKANQHRLAYLKDEAFAFVGHTSEKFKEESSIAKPMGKVKNWLSYN